MSQKSIKIVINGIYSKPPKNNYPTNKTDVYHIDDIWSLDTLYLKDYGPEKNRGYRYVLVIIEKFSKYGWTTPLKNKNAQTIKDSFQNTLINSKRKPNLNKTDRSKDFYNNIFQNFLNNNNIKHCSRNTPVGGVFAECFNKIIRILLKRPVFENEEAIGLMYYQQ